MSAVNVSPNIPTYEIVCASVGAEIEDPQDHPWIRLPDKMNVECSRSRGCNSVKVSLRKCEFTDSNNTYRYELGQCSVCKTVFFFEHKRIN